VHAQGSHPGANAASGADTINFNIGGGGVKTIAPDSKLPPITDPVTIDGYTQPGASPNTLSKGTNAKLMIELDGENVVEGAALLNGLEIRASDSVVRGLVINRFSGNTVDIFSPSLIVSGNRVEGNFIGTDPTGTQDLGNRFGVSIAPSADNTVGGATPEVRNLISGNGLDGVVIGGSASTGNEVIGNLIGTDASGTGALGNSGRGVSDGGFDNAIGGAEPGTANTIAFNGENGVVVHDGITGESILGNSIFSNGSLGIDLGDDGRTVNDFADLDEGANDLQNFPVLSQATTRRSSTIIGGKLASTPSQTFTIQFFSNPRGDAEGKTFLGAKCVTTDARGNASFSFRARRVAGIITATATNADGSTSEFSAPRKVKRR
jgi:hypothetical protein